MKRIFVVDDDVAILEVVQIVLEEEGYQVVTDTGELAVDKATADDIDLVLLDIWMKGVDGRDVARQCKAVRPTLPIVLMSAHSSSRAAVEETGVEGFLEKPFDVEDLVAMVSKYADG